MPVTKSVLVLVLAAACYGIHDPPPPHPTVTATHRPDPFRYLPRDSAMVIRIDLAQARANAHWKQLEPTLLDRFEEIPEMLTTTRTIWVATGSHPDQFDKLVVVFDGLPRQQVDADARAHHATVEQDGAFTIYRGKHSTHAWWVTDDFMIAVATTNAAELDEIRHDDHGLYANVELMDAIHQAWRGPPTAWIAGSSSAGPAFAGFLNWSAPPRAFWGRLDLGTDLDFQFGARFPDGESAARVSGELGALLDVMKTQPKNATYAADAHIWPDGDVVRISQALASPAIDRMIGIWLSP